MQSQEQFITKPQSYIVQYKDLNKDKIGSSKGVEKSVPNSKNNEKYKELPIVYNYGTVETPRIDTLNVEFSEVSCPQGIIERDEKDGRKQYSIKCVYDPVNDEVLLSKIDEIYKATALELQKNKQFLGCFHFNAEMAEACGYKNPVYHQRDQTTGEVIPGRKSSQFIKLIKSGSGYQSLFTDPSGNPIEWKYLIGVDLKLIPLVKFEKIYYGGKPSIQCKLQSCIVVSAVKPNTETTQTDTMAVLNSKNPEIVSQMEEQMRKLMESYNKISTSTESNASAGPIAPIAVPIPTQPAATHQEIPVVQATNYAQTASVPSLQSAPAEQASFTSYMSAQPSVATAPSIQPVEYPASQIPQQSYHSNQNSPSQQVTYE